MMHKMLKDSAAAKRLRRGLTLVEAAMVLALLGLVIAGALLLYQNASTNSKISESSSQMAAVSQSIRQVYAGQPTYTGLAYTDIENALPKKMTTGAGLKHAFNGDLKVASATTTVAGDSFTIEMDNIPQEGCVALATKDFGRAVQSVKVGTTEATQGAMKPADAKTACATSVNNITWKLM